VRRYTVSEGIVIRRKPLPSGDLVVTLLGVDGKWRAVARKGKLPGGNLGKLSLFHDVTVQHYRRREEDLALITQVQLSGALPRLSRPDVYPYANLLAELVDALTVDVHLGEQLYEYLTSGLRGLSGHRDPEHVALLYAWRLLRLAGLAPTVTGCARCGAVAASVAFDPAAGGLVCARCAPQEAGDEASWGAIRVEPAAVTELVDLVDTPVRAALDRPPQRREWHWRVLTAHVNYHVRELNSLTCRPRDLAGQTRDAARAPA